MGQHITVQTQNKSSSKSESLMSYKLLCEQGRERERERERERCRWVAIDLFIAPPSCSADLHIITVESEEPEAITVLITGADDTVS